LLTDSLLDGNATTLSGGGIANFGDFTMDGTILSSNEATEDGGGLYNIGRASMRDSRLTGNTAFQGGGAENGFTGELDIMNSTIDANNAVGLLGQGGGVSSAGILSITNVTLSGNIAEDDGGALKIEAEAITYLLNATIADNEAHGAPGVGAGIFDLSGTAIIQIANTILDNNIGEDFYETPEPANCFANMSTEGFNLSSDSTCSSSLFHDFDRNNIDPLLDGLQLNAPGSTPTHALLPDSPAMDWIDSFSCPPPTTDQRGVSRPQSTACDSGAYEVEP
jgi:hypothetical protein